MSERISILEKLMDVRAEMAVPKTEQNEFGGFAYRSAEKMLAYVNPLLQKHRLTMDFNDRIEVIDGVRYCVTTITVYDVDTGDSKSCEYPVREPDSLPKMVAAQVSGTVMSYAHKYAMNGMFCVASATEELDSMDTTRGCSTAKTSGYNQGHNPQGGYNQGSNPQGGYRPAMTPPLPGIPQAVAMPAPKPTQAQVPRELPDGTYVTTGLIDIKNVTSRNGNRCMYLAFATSQGTLARYTAHGYGMCGKLLKSLGWDGDSNDIDGIRNYLSKHVYKITQSRDPKKPAYAVWDVEDITTPTTMAG